MELVERPVLTWRWVVLLAVGFATAATVLTLFRQAGELPVYTTAAERDLRGEQFYRPDDPPAFTYPPFSVLPFVPLTGLPPLLRKTPWWIANFSLLAGSLWLLTCMVWPVLRAGVHAGRARPWIAATAIGLLSGRYLITALNYQSTDYIVLFCVVAAGYGLSRSKGPAAGAFAGLATAMKATPLLFLPVLIWQRHGWRPRPSSPRSLRPRCCRTCSSRTPTAGCGASPGSNGLFRKWESARRPPPREHGRAGIR